jgi:hypothetical protein
MNTVARPGRARLALTVPSRAESAGHADHPHFFQVTSTAQASPAQPATTVTASEWVLA